MSYILDALKKSDLQRKQGDVPTLQTVHLPSRPQDRTPRALYGVIALLLLLLMFVLGYLFSQQFFQSAAESPESVQSTTDKSAQAVEQQVGVLPKKVDSNKMGGIKMGGGANRAAAEHDRLSANEASSSEQARLQQHSTTKPDTSAALPSNHRLTQADLMGIPYLHELPDYQQQSIPVMEFAGHVYSSDASSRSVIINGQFMEAGDSLLPGLSIESITMNGVVFAYQDTLFRVDILQDWSLE